MDPMDRVAELGLSVPRRWTVWTKWKRK